MEDFSSSYSKNYRSYPQQAIMTQMLILLESKTGVNSCSGNKLWECMVCKGNGNVNLVRRINRVQARHMNI